MLKRIEIFNSTRPLEVVSYWDREGWLILDPPYQRGNVWGPIRRVNLIKSLILQIPIPSIIINDRSRKRGSDDFGYAVIDGKQRLTSILMFLNSQLPVPGHWFDLPAETVLYRDLPLVRQRQVHNAPLSFAEGALETIEDERLVFELVNFGGVPQGETD